MSFKIAVENAAKELNIKPSELNKFYNAYWNVICTILTENRIKDHLDDYEKFLVAINLPRLGKIYLDKKNIKKYIKFNKNENKKN